MPSIILRSIDGSHLACTVKGKRDVLRPMLVNFFLLMQEKEVFSASELHDAVTMSTLLPPMELVDIYTVTSIHVK